MNSALDVKGSALWCRFQYSELRREGWDHWESVRLVIINAAS
jgi:hypothetical protein